MDFLVSCTANVAAKITECTFALIGRQCRYLFSYTSIIEALKGKVNNLKTERGKMESKASEAKKNGEKIVDEVSKWLNDVNEFLEESNTFLDKDIKEVDTKCIKGLFPNLCSRYQLSRKAEKKIVDVEALMKRSNPTKISEYVQPPPIEFTASENSVAFNSRKEIFDEIYASLRYDHIRMTGICGMAGVGKTTLVEQIGKQAESSRLFDVILLAAVSQNPNFLYIQQRFAERMGVTKFDEKTKEERASRLHGILERRLNDGEKILVILDDVWEELKMSDLGIPFNYDDSKSQRSCKIVVTSRDENLCNKMGSQKIYKVKPLHKNEAWSLFERITGLDTLNSKERRDIASRILKACAGVPLAISIIASALRNNNSLDCWRDAIWKIKQGNMDQKVFKALELSYNFLKKESDAQELFLLCILFREDVNIPICDLLIYGLGWGLFQNTATLESAFVRINALVEYLKSSSLLLDGTNKEYVKMHDVVREFALSVASQYHHMIRVEGGSNFDSLASNDSLKLCSSISLQIKDAKDLPSQLDLPELKLLKLESGFCPSPVVLPYDMIAPMQKLKVLSMHWIQIMSLPQAFKYFQELRTLSFYSCEIEDISIIGELKNLFFLRFHGCNIKALPEEIGKLTKLKLLDLSRCEELTLVPSSVMRSLSRLEGLLIGNFKGWAISAEDNRNNLASLEDLKCLPNLVLLEVHIPDIELWPEDLLFENLTRFKISVGDKLKWSEYYFLSSSNILKLKDVDVTHRPLTKGVDVLFQTVEVINMENMNGFQDGLYERSDITRFLELKGLYIENFSKMKYVADATIARCDVFPRLEELRISSLPQLMSILKSPAESAPLEKLRVLKIWRCPKLRSIFSQSMVICLLQLVEMEVCKCEALEEIVDCGNKPEVQHIVFHQLSSLRLSNLPNLKSFLSSINALAGDNHHAPCVRVGLFQNKVAFPKLEFLRLSKLDNLREIWTGASQLELSFPQLNQLYLDGLSNLMHVWSMRSCETISAPSLSVLNIIYCPKMEVIAEIEENATALIEFPCLQCMVLNELSNFKGFHTKRFSLFGEKVAFPKLEKLELSNLGSLKEIWTSPSQVELLVPELKEFHMLCLPNLVHVWNMASCETIRFQSLSILTMKSCPMMEVVAKIKENATVLIEFPCLQYMALHDLSNLKSFLMERSALFDEMVAFPKLNKLELWGLDSLTKVWNMGSYETIHFPSLSILEIESCPMMEVVVEIEENATALIEFPCLQSMSLKYLSNLQGFNTKRSILFDGKVAFPKLEELELSKLDNLKEIWTNSSQLELSFPQLNELYLDGLSNLMHVWNLGSYETISAPRLSVLNIIYCPLMEVIAEIEENVTALIEFPCLQRMVLSELFNFKGFHTKRLSLFDEKVVLPVLEYLRLEGLRNIRGLWCCKSPVKTNEKLFEIEKFAAEDIETTLTFHRLKELRVEGLPKLEYLFDKKVSFPALEKLYIKKMEGLTQIWEMQLSPGSFHQLKIVEVTGNPILLNIVPSNLLQNLSSLRELVACNCKTMKEIIGDASEGLEHAKVLILPQLESIQLLSLPMLTSFYHHKFDFLFPSLTKVSLWDCQKMETFTYGNLKTPVLNRIGFVYSDEQWHDDLNSAVQYAYQERHKDDIDRNDGDKSDDGSN